MADLRHLNQSNPLSDFLSSFNSPNHPFAQAYNPSSRDGQGPTSNEGQPGAQNENQDAADPPEHSPEDFAFGGRGPHHHGGHFGGPRHHGGPHGFGRGGWGGRGWGGRNRGGHCPAYGGFGTFPTGGAFDMSKLGEFISQFIPEDVMAGAREQGAKSGDNNKDFTPAADIFDTTESYVVHVSLPGAKKEDVGVNWDADKSELNIAGVIYRPGDEAFLKTLALNERKVGLFERKVKLGSKANPAQVDADTISAKMEDGVLIVTIPKVESFVEVKKVDID